MSVGRSPPTGIAPNAIMLIGSQQLKGPVYESVQVKSVVQVAVTVTGSPHDIDVVPGIWMLAANRSVADTGTITGTAGKFETTCTWPFPGPGQSLEGLFP